MKASMWVSSLQSRCELVVPLASLRWYGFQLWNSICLQGRMVFQETTPDAAWGFEGTSFAPSCGSQSALSGYFTLHPELICSLVPYKRRYLSRRRRYACGGPIQPSNPNPTPPNRPLRRRCTCAGFFGCWIRCREPFPAAVGERVGGRWSQLRGLGRPPSRDDRW